MTEKVRTRRPVSFDERSTLLAAVCTALVAIPYISVLTHVFDYHDSFYFFAYANHFSCRAHPQFAFFFLVGRPFYAYLNCFFGALITTLQHAVVVHAIGVMIAVLSAIWIVRVLRELGMPVMVATVAACALVWLPGFQFFIAMTQATSIVFALPLVVLAFVELRVGSAALDRMDLRLASRHLTYSTLWLLVGAEIYQQMASLIFCFVFAAVWKLGPDLRRGGRVLIASSIGVFGVQGVLYVLTYYAVTARVFSRMTGQTLAEASAVDSTREIVLSADVGAKLHLLYELTPNSFALWFVGAPVAFYGTVAALCAIAVFTGFILDIRTSGKRPDPMAWAFAFEKLTWLGGLVLLVNAPNLVAKSDSLLLRHMVPYQWLIVLLLLSTGWRLAAAIAGAAAYRVGAAALACFAVVGLGSASWNLYRNMVVPNAGEFRFIQQALGDYVPTASAPACVIQPDVVNVGAFDHAQSRMDEFGKLTTMFPQDVPWIVSAAVKSRTGQINGNSRVLKPAELPTKFNCGVVIDMRRYVSQLKGAEPLMLQGLN
jgi:hypothetical protein